MFLDTELVSWRIAIIAVIKVWSSGFKAAPMLENKLMSPTDDECPQRSAVMDCTCDPESDKHGWISAERWTSGMTQFFILFLDFRPLMFENLLRTFRDQFIILLTALPKSKNIFLKTNSISLGLYLVDGSVFSSSVLVLLSTNQSWLSIWRFLIAVVIIIIMTIYEGELIYLK